MWQTHDRPKMDIAETMAHIRSLPSNMITILDGPSGCGKTAIVERTYPQIRFVTVEELRDRMVYAAQSGIPQYLHILYTNDLLCIEDLDLLRAYSTTLELLAGELRIMSVNQHIILTCINFGEDLVKLLTKAGCTTELITYVK